MASKHPAAVSYGEPRQCYLDGVTEAKAPGDDFLRHKSMNLLAHFFVLTKIDTTLKINMEPEKG